jgi:hypothetical protein
MWYLIEISNQVTADSENNNIPYSRVLDEVNIRNFTSFIVIFAVFKADSFYNLIDLLFLFTLPIHVIVVP